MNKENDEEIIENTLEINEDSINKKNIELNDFLTFLLKIL